MQGLKVIRAQREAEKDGPPGSKISHGTQMKNLYHKISYSVVTSSQYGSQKFKVTIEQTEGSLSLFLKMK